MAIVRLICKSCFIVALPTSRHFLQTYFSLIIMWAFTVLVIVFCQGGIKIKRTELKKTVHERKNIKNKRNRRVHSQPWNLSNAYLTPATLDDTADAFVCSGICFFIIMQNGRKIRPFFYSSVAIEICTNNISSIYLNYIHLNIITITFIQLNLTYCLSLFAVAYECWNELRYKYR